MPPSVLVRVRANSPVLGAYPHLAAVFAALPPGATMYHVAQNPGQQGKVWNAAGTAEWPVYPAAGFPAYWIQAPAPPPAGADDPSWR